MTACIHVKECKMQTEAGESSIRQAGRQAGNKARSPKLIASGHEDKGEYSSLSMSYESLGIANNRFIMLSRQVPKQHRILHQQSQSKQDQIVCHSGAGAEQKQ